MYNLYCPSLTFHPDLREGPHPFPLRLFTTHPRGIPIGSPVRGGVRVPPTLHFWPMEHIPGFGSVGAYRFQEPYEEYSSGEEIPFWIERGTIYVSLVEYMMYVSGKRDRTSELEKEIRQYLLGHPGPFVSSAQKDRLNALPGGRRFLPSTAPVVDLGVVLYTLEWMGSKEFIEKHQSVFWKWKQAVREGYQTILRRWSKVVAEEQQITKKQSMSSRTLCVSVELSRVGHITINQSHGIRICDEGGEVLMQGECTPSFYVERVKGISYPLLICS